MLWVEGGLQAEAVDEGNRGGRFLVRVQIARHDTILLATPDLRCQKPLPATVPAILLVGDPVRTAALGQWIGQLTLMLAIWALFPLWYAIWPGKQESGRASTTPPTPGERLSKG